MGPMLRPKNKPRGQSTYTPNDVVLQGYLKKSNHSMVHKSSVRYFVLTKEGSLSYFSDINGDQRATIEIRLAKSIKHENNCIVIAMPDREWKLFDPEISNKLHFVQLETWFVEFTKINQQRAAAASLAPPQPDNLEDLNSTSESQVSADSQESPNGLVLWLDASTSTNSNFQHDKPISTWTTELLPAGTVGVNGTVSLVGGAPRKPVFDNIGANDHPCVIFMGGSCLVFPRLKRVQTVVAVVWVSRSSPASAAFATFKADGIEPVYIRLGDLGQPNRVWSMPSIDQANTATYPTEEFCSPAGSAVYVNGVANTQPEDPRLWCVVSWVSSKPYNNVELVIGGDSVNYNKSFVGAIGELQVFDFVLEDNVRKELETKLTEKWMQSHKVSVPDSANISSPPLTPAPAQNAAPTELPLTPTSRPQSVGPIASPVSLAVVPPNSSTTTTTRTSLTIGPGSRKSRVVPTEIASVAQQPLHSYDLPSDASLDSHLTVSDCTLGLPFMWQSFTASKSGKLTKIQLQYININSHTTLRVHLGEGSTGQLVAEVIMPESEQLALQTIVLPRPVQVDQGGKYTFVIFGHSYQVLACSSSLYQQGTAGKINLNAMLLPDTSDTTFANVSLFFAAYISR
eukprot:c4729_g1_i2.p1 GENE.c4729_g1_i2~~c4729_g1_i2.p1  ORF type:complete len:626 (+),score=142.72 c4729_g1_i2:3-1880(+)